MEHLTATVSCFARAYHYKNNSTRIFADGAAELLLGKEYDRIAQSMSRGIDFFLPKFQGSAEEGLRLIVDRQLSPSVLGRSAYCERMLENEKRLGCRQYVVFASGYDTYAVRNHDPSLSVFELDLPEVLADKQAKTENAGLRTAAIYVPCDLSDGAWKDRLLESGFRRGRKAFGSLLGISYYLEKSEFRDLLLTLGGILCEGSAICFDYPSEEDSRETRINQALAHGAGEEMKARYVRREMEELLAECGFLIYGHLDHEEMTRQYFSAYNECCPTHPMKAPNGVCYALAVRKDVHAKG